MAFKENICQKSVHKRPQNNGSPHWLYSLLFTNNPFNTWVNVHQSSNSDFLYKEKKKARVSCQCVCDYRFKYCPEKRIAI